MRKGTIVKLVKNSIRDHNDLSKTEEELRAIRGKVLGEDICVEQYWTPVLWDDEEDPSFHKRCCLELAEPKKEAKK